MNEPIWYPLPDKNLVRFSFENEKNEGVSAQLGRPMHDKLIRATVVSPGSRKSEAILTLERERAQPGDGPRTLKVYESVLDSLPGLREALERFKRSQGPVDGSGTALEAWTTLDVATVADLKGINIHFVEQLAGASDAALNGIGMGARALKQKAQAFLDAAKGQAPLDRLVERVNELERQSAIKDQQIADLVAERQAAQQKEPANAA